MKKDLLIGVWGTLFCLISSLIEQSSTGTRSISINYFFLNGVLNKITFKFIVALRCRQELRCFFDVRRDIHLAKLHRCGLNARATRAKAKRSDFYTAHPQPPFIFHPRITAVRHLFLFPKSCRSVDVKNVSLFLFFLQLNRFFLHFNVYFLCKLVIYELILIGKKLYFCDGKKFTLWKKQTFLLWWENLFYSNMKNTFF